MENLDLVSQPMILVMLCLVALCALALLAPQLPVIFKTVERIAGKAFDALGKFERLEFTLSRAPPQKTRLEKDESEEKDES